MTLNVKTASDGLILNANGTNADGVYFSQALEEEVEGDTILSFKVSAVVGTITFYNLNSTNSTNSGNTVAVTSDGIYKVKGNSTKLVMARLTKGSSCKIEWMKLEQGSIATPFITPNRAEEFVKCCRFFQTLQVLYSAYCVTEQHYYQKLPLVTALRANPTVSITDQYTYNVKSKKLEWRSDGGIGWLNLDLVATNSSQTVCQMICACDAEIY